MIDREQMFKELNAKRKHLTVRSVHPRTLPIFKEWAELTGTSMGRAMDLIALTLVKPDIEILKEQASEEEKVIL